MKTAIALLSLITLGAPLLSATPDGQLVRGPTYEGAIFTPEMLPKKSARDPDPLVAANVPLGKGTYWTPTAQQVDQFEQAFARATREAWKKLPPPYSRDHDYVALKTGSRDWRKPLPADFDTNFLYHFDESCLTPQFKRQYIGLTVAGRRMLVANFSCNVVIQNPGDLMYIGPRWKREWVYIYDAGCQIFYDPATGKLWEIDT